jgi:hypothetical protein
MGTWRPNSAGAWPFNWVALVGGFGRPGRALHGPSDPSRPILPHLRQADQGTTPPCPEPPRRGRAGALPTIPPSGRRALSSGNAARGGRWRAQTEPFPSGPDLPPVIWAPRAARPPPPRLARPGVCTGPGREGEGSSGLTAGHGTRPPQWALARAGKGGGHGPLHSVVSVRVMRMQISNFRSGIE